MLLSETRRRGFESWRSKTIFLDEILVWIRVIRYGMHNCFLSFLTLEVKMIQNTNKFLFYMHFKNVFKSSKGALIKEKIFWHFLIPHTNFVWLHFHLNRHGAIGSRTRPRAWWYFLRAFTRKNPYGSTSLLSALGAVLILIVHTPDLKVIFYERAVLDFF